MGDVTYLNAHYTGDPLQWRQHSLADGGLGHRWRPAAALVDGARRWAGASVAPSGAAVWWRPSRALSVWRRFGKGALGCRGGDIGSTVVGATGVGIFLFVLGVRSRSGWKSFRRFLAWVSIFRRPALGP